MTLRGKAVDCLQGSGRWNDRGLAFTQLCMNGMT